MLLENCALTARRTPAKFGSRHSSHSRPSALFVAKRWHTHVEQVVEKGSKRVDDLKAAAEAKLASAPKLSDFMAESGSEAIPEEEIVPTKIPYLDYNPTEIGEGRKVFIESYGCQMNVSDTQIAYSIMQGAGYGRAEAIEEADVIFLNTCAIREHAEHKIWSRLGTLKAMKSEKEQSGGLVIGVLGCMAERLKEQILDQEKLVDVVAGPDAYRDLPRLVSKAGEGQRVINTMLSQDETYADIAPVRVDDDGISAFVSIGRGCNQHCTYCIVPRTRGIERSRPASSIYQEIQELSRKGYKEVTLLGQNVNSYNDKSVLNDSLEVSSNESKLPQEGEEVSQSTKRELPLVKTAKGFKTIYRTPTAGITFTELIDNIAGIDPEMRIRFTSPHPKDFPDELLQIIKKHPNVCNAIHLPAQSGNSEVLERMRRGYTREAYLDLVARIREIIGDDVTISSDFISGFCGETEEQHQDTVTLLSQVKYDQAFMFAYSMRERTPAHRKFVDDVPESTKRRRLAEVIDTFHANVKLRNEAQIGKNHLILVEGTSRRSDKDLAGRNDGNKKVIFPQCAVPTLHAHLKTLAHGTIDMSSSEMVKPGEYVVVQVTGTTGVSLTGKALARATLQEFYQARAQGLL